MKEFIIFLIAQLKEGINLDCYQRQVNPVARQSYPFVIIDPISTSFIGWNTVDQDSNPYRLFENSVQLAIISDITSEYATQIASDAVTYMGSLSFIEKANLAGFAILNIAQPFNIQYMELDRSTSVQQCVITIPYIYGNKLTSPYGEITDIKGEVYAR